MATTKKITTKKVMAKKVMTKKASTNKVMAKKVATKKVMAKPSAKKIAVKPISKKTKGRSLRKFEEGGKQVGIKTNDSFENVSQNNKPIAPKSPDNIEMKLQTELVPDSKKLSEIKMPTSKAEVAPVSVAKVKAKTLPGGFSSEAQKNAYIKNVKAKIAAGYTIDQLVKSKVGTKAGLEALGLGKYSKGTELKQSLKKKLERLDMKKKGTELKQSLKKKLEKAQTAKAKPQTAEEKYKAFQVTMKKAGDNLLKKGASGAKLSPDEWKNIELMTTYENWAGGRSDRDNLSKLERAAYDNAITQKFTQIMPKLRGDLTDALLTVAVPGGGVKAIGTKMLAKAATKKLITEGSKKLLTKAAPKAIAKSSPKLLNSGTQKLLGEGTKKLAGTSAKKLIVPKAKKIVKKAVQAYTASEAIGSLAQTSKKKK